MFINTGKPLTELQRVFLEPTDPTHRQYEALRAYFVEGLPSQEVAQRFGYTPGSFRVLCHQFRQHPQRAFFLQSHKGHHRAPKRDPVRDQVIALRKQNFSIYDISETLKAEGRRLSPVTISLLLKEEGFARLPRRADDERPDTPRPMAAAGADVRRLDLRPRQLRTKFGGVFLFLPYLAALPFDQLLDEAGLPGSQKIPAAHAMRALLALKLFGNARHSHVMSAVFDEGLALFAGLNVTPKRAFLTEYSCRIDPACYPVLMRLWHDATSTLGLPHGVSFDLDFHTIPFHGEDALVQKHYVSKRSRRQKGMLAFLAHDADTRVFCYANGQLQKAEQNDEILQFVAYWEQRTGQVPHELIFDSKLTTYANLNQLNQRGIDFITLRRRSPKMLAALTHLPASAWRRVALQNVARAYRRPRVLDDTIHLTGYEGPLRQLTVADLGHEEPTFLVTNQLRRAASTLIERYAQRMVIENSIADGIDFFHMDALSSAVAMKITCDLQLTLMASSLYRLLGAQVGRGYEVAKGRHIFRDFIDAVGLITLSDDTMHVQYQKRAHNPLLIAAGFGTTDVPVPWLGNKRLRFVFG
jgi:transposase-like protein